MRRNKIYQNVLVGSKGYIGRHLEPVLKASGDTVFPIDRGMNIFEGITRGRVIYYLLGQMGPNFVADAEIDLLKNTLAVLDCDVNERFVYFSSALVYGDTAAKAKETTSLHPIDTYSQFKTLCEDEVRSRLHKKKIPATIIRLSNVYGRRGNNGFVGLLIKKAYGETDHTININGDGKQTRDYIFIDDAVRAIAAVTKLNQGSDTVNIASGKSSSLMEVVKIFNHISPVKVRVKITGVVQNEVKLSCLVIQKLAQKYGYSPRIGLAEGMEITLREYGKK